MFSSLCCVFIVSNVIGLTACFGWTNCPKRNLSSQFERRDFSSTFAKIVVATWFTDPLAANSSNLPPSTGADLSKCGTIGKLVPILEIEGSIRSAKNALTRTESTAVLTENQIQEILSLLKAIPSEEVKFKRIFDEYSDPVSYKQKYMDQNAFLVYYSKGFDGPNRPSIEDGEIPKQTLQYGARNDAWSAFDDLILELKFAMKEGSTANDIADLLDRISNALNSYLSLVPSPDLVEARQLSSQS